MVGFIEYKGKSVQGLIVKFAFALGLSMKSREMEIVHV